MAGSHGSVDGGGMPQSTTPGIEGGHKSARIRDNSSGGSSELPRRLEVAIAALG
jgi:hypothetical protein